MWSFLLGANHPRHAGLRGHCFEQDTWARLTTQTRVLYCTRCSRDSPGSFFADRVYGGGLAQLGERLNGIQEVGSSNLLPSTSLRPERGALRTTPWQASLRPEHGVLRTTPWQASLHFVYILQSKSTGRFYIGSCKDLLKRFRQHQCGYSAATKNRGPWWMPYHETHASLSAARAREAELKRKKSAESIRRFVLRVMPDLELL